MNNGNKISWAIVIAGITWTVAGVWWASHVDARVRIVENIVDKRGVYIEEFIQQREILKQLRVDIGRVEGQIGIMRQVLDDIRAEQREARRAVTNPDDIRARLGQHHQERRT